MKFLASNLAISSALLLILGCILVGISAHTAREIHTRPRQAPTERNPFLEWLASLIGTTTTTAAPPLTPATNCASCKCGRTNKATRIVGGTETAVNQYPWMTMLQYGGTFYCGGSLISDRHVLTAAHCVHGFNASKISVVLLDHDRSSTTEAETITGKVSRVIKHNGYNSNNYNSDIAVLVLQKPVSFNEKLRPVCLPDMKKSFTGYDILREPPSESQPAVEKKDNAFLEWLELLTGIQRPLPPLKPAENCTECKCGRTNQIKRIVGGMETRVNQFPWMAILKYGDSFYCGGSLITDRHVMTAAHCVTGFNPRRISVTLLDHDRSTDSESETITARVERVIRHPAYNPGNYDNDVAILKLDKVLEMNDRLRPVCQPTSGESFAGENGTVTGWGTTSQGGDVSNTLQEVIVPILSNEDCRKTAYGERRITDNMLCAGYPEGMKDSCQGDSGGPLHVTTDSEMESAESIYQIAGVVSWGEGCAKPNYPGVYSRVNRFEAFISNSTIDGCYCTQ